METRLRLLVCMARHKATPEGWARVHRSAEFANRSQRYFSAARCTLFLMAAVAALGIIWYLVDQSSTPPTRRLITIAAAIAIAGWIWTEIKQPSWSVEYDEPLVLILPIALPLVALFSLVASAVWVVKYLLYLTRIRPKPDSPDWEGPAGLALTGASFLGILYYFPLTILRLVPGTAGIIMICTIAGLLLYLNLKAFQYTVMAKNPLTSILQSERPGNTGRAGLHDRTIDPIALEQLS